MVIPYPKKAPCRHLRLNQLILRVCRRGKKIELIKTSSIRSCSTQNIHPNRPFEVFPRR